MKGVKMEKIIEIGYKNDYASSFFLKTEKHEFAGECARRAFLNQVCKRWKELDLDIESNQGKMVYLIGGQIYDPATKPEREEIEIYQKERWQKRKLPAGWSVSRTSRAETGSVYYELVHEELDISLKLRTSDHSPLYSHDFSISPLEGTWKKFCEFLKEMEEKKKEKNN